MNPRPHPHAVLAAMALPFWLAAIAIAAVSGTARAADERLLVVVESTPGAGIDARDVRRAIGAELGVSVVAPTDPRAADAANVLIVAISRTEIRMSLRGSAAGLVTRTVGAPPDRPEQLLEIGTLANRLARDQMGGIVALPVALPDTAKELVIADADTRPATEPAPTVSPPTAPPPIGPPTLPPVARPVTEPAESVSTRPAEGIPKGPRWSFTAGGGPTAAVVPPPQSPVGPEPRSTVSWFETYQLEVQRQSSADGLIIGAALDIGTDAPFIQREWGYGAPGTPPVLFTTWRLFGVAGFVGTSWHRRRWFLETTVGLGLERVLATHVNQASFPCHPDESSCTSFDVAAYARGVADLGFPLTRSLALVAHLGVNASTGDFSSTIVTAAGLRVTVH